MRYTKGRIDLWPGELTPDYRRQRWTFKASWGSTQDTLDRELRMLDVTEAVLQRAFRPEDLRLDGEPRAGARAIHPGVIISFESKHGPLRYACDRFTTWEHNVRAIALALEALRKVDRYGVGSGSEQYQGWKRLGTGDATIANGVKYKMSKDDAVRWLRAFRTPDNGSLADSYRAALKACHPDAGGSREDWDRLQEAKAVLGL